MSICSPLISTDLSNCGTSSRDEARPRDPCPHAAGHPPQVGGQVGRPRLARRAVPHDEAAARAGGHHAAARGGAAGLGGGDDGDGGERVGGRVPQEGQRGEGARAEQEHGPADMRSKVESR